MKYVNILIQFVKREYSRLLFIVLLHIAVETVLSTPYINIIRFYLSLLPFIIDWVVILYLFRPKKETLLILGIIVWITAFVTSFFIPPSITDKLSQGVFVLLITYIIMAFPKVRVWE